jgi:hypothetical protein
MLKKGKFINVGVVPVYEGDPGCITANLIDIRNFWVVSVKIGIILYPASFGNIRRLQMNRILSGFLMINFGKTIIIHNKSNILLLFNL